MQLLRSHFRPEFLNRIDEIIVFRALPRTGHPDRRAAPGPGDPSDVAEKLAPSGPATMSETCCAVRATGPGCCSSSQDGLPIVKVPRSPQRLALQWQQFYDAVLEKRLSHDGERTLARHVSNLSLYRGRRDRADLDVAEGQPIASARSDGRLRRRGADRTCRGAEGDLAEPGMRGETMMKSYVAKGKGSEHVWPWEEGTRQAFSHSENCKIQAPIPLDAKTFSHAGSASSPPRPMPPCSGSS